MLGGQAEISFFPQSEAESLAQELNYGALPITLSELNVESMSPSPDIDQLEVGLITAAIGLGLVVIYSCLYYRGLGIVSVSSLIVAGILAYLSVVLLSIFPSSGFALSLAGIAGLIVAIGISADSFVVYFERLRDEVRDGKSLRSAAESGWNRARRTILVSDTVSFLAALLLWYFSITDVKGFAFTLGLTTLVDVVVVFLFTKPMVTILARTRFFSSGPPMSGLDPARLGARTPWRSGVLRPAARRAEARRRHDAGPGRPTMQMGYRGPFSRGRSTSCGRTRKGPLWVPPKPSATLVPSTGRQTFETPRTIASVTSIELGTP